MTNEELTKIIEKPKVFLTDDFDIIDFDCDNLERYEFAKNELDPTDYDLDNFNDYLKDNDISINNFDDFIDSFDDWTNDYLSYEELYQVPMMNALRYYPFFCSFTEEDQKKCNGATTLLYDNELDAWAVGMTGGGMDLAPHLLDTFIKLGNGVPMQLAENISRNYNAYVDKETHLTNCDLLADAYIEKGKQFKEMAKRLK